jgi:tripartite-type tricarboxylate transporter receptor subunit TctC
MQQAIKTCISTFIAAALLAAASLSGAQGTSASSAPSATSGAGQDYPNKPVKILVGYVAGGSPDFVARALAQKLGDILGQAFTVENRPGAGGVTATGQMSKLPADGYTLLLGDTSQLGIAPHIFKTLPYDTLKDLTPIAGLTYEPLMLVTNAKSNIKTMQELLAYVKANPGKVNYGSSGIGSIHHIAMEMLKADAGLDIAHIPYKGSGQSVPALLAGDIPVLLTAFTASAPHIKAGTMNLLAVTSGKRWSRYPDTPSLAEFVKDYDYQAETGLLGPAGMPPAIVNKLSAAVKQATESPDFLAKFKETGFSIIYANAPQYGDIIRKNLAKYDRAVKVAKIQAE